jgi:hypothetical protein
MRGVAVLAVVAVMGVVVPGSAAHRERVRCPPRHAHVLASDRSATVYWFPTLGEAFDERGTRDWEGSNAFACFQGRPPTALHDVFEYSDNVPPCDNGCLRSNWRSTIKLAGSMLAYATDTQEDTKYYVCFCERWGITVRDLRNGRLVHRAPTGPHRGMVSEEAIASEPDFKDKKGDRYVGIGPAESVVVKRDGSVAWIAENWIARLDALRAGLPLGKPSYELRAIDQDGEHLLASGVDLEPRRLALHADILEWTQGGVRSIAILH